MCPSNQFRNLAACKSDHVTTQSVLVSFLLGLQICYTWTSEMRYVGVHFINFYYLDAHLTMQNAFYTTSNTTFVTTGKIAPEEVIL